MFTIQQFKNKTFAILLALALLWVNQLGFSHSILHANWENTTTSSTKQSAKYNAPDALHHSCIAFDAITLAAVLHTTPFIAALSSSIDVPHIQNASQSWDAPLICAFLSRAPPQLS